MAVYWHPQTPLFHGAMTSETRTCNSGCAGNGSTSASFVYDDPTGRANLITDSRYDSETGGSVNITQAYNARGDVIDSWNARGIQTHYVYEGSICSGSYPTDVYQEYRRAEQRYFKYSYNCATALMTEEKDMDNSVSRIFGYDHLGRSSSITEQGNATGASRRHQVLYWADAMTVETRSDLNTSGDGAIRSLTRFDGLGRIRLIRTVVRLQARERRIHDPVSP